MAQHTPQWKLDMIQLRTENERMRKVAQEAIELVANNAAPTEIWTKLEEITGSPV